MIDAQVIWSCGAFTSAIARNKVPPPHAESISNPITPDGANDRPKSLKEVSQRENPECK